MGPNRRQPSMQALAAALQPNLNPRPGGKPTKATKGACYKCGTPGPTQPCFQCGKRGHWASHCPNPRPPSTPCPACQEEGHWKSDCPTLKTGIASQRGVPSQDPGSSFQLLHLDDD